jgi:hypothetical protein
MHVTTLQIDVYKRIAIYVALVACTLLMAVFTMFSDNYFLHDT